MKKSALIIIKFYRLFLSPYMRTFLGGGCIFNPTCSQYSIDVIEKHGFKKGINMSFRRIIKCSAI